MRRLEFKSQLLWTITLRGTRHRPGDSLITYRRLHAFRETDADSYFGREVLTRQIIEEIQKEEDEHAQEDKYEAS